MGREEAATSSLGREIGSMAHHTSWYEVLARVVSWDDQVPVADNLYEEHLEELRAERLIDGP
jgi:hypothetical protein